MTPFDLIETQSVNPVDAPAESAVVAPAQRTGSGGGSAPLYEYQRLSRIGLLYWFCSRNFFRLFSRVAVVCLFLWLCFFGGIQTLLQLYLKQVSSMHVRNTPKSLPSEASPSPSGTPPPSEASPSPPDTPPPSGAAPSPPDTPPPSGAAPSPPDTPPPSVSDFDYLVFLSPDFGIFNGGDYVQPGQSFVESHYLGGVHVAEFNHRNGFISLSDGRVIRLRRH